MSFTTDPALKLQAVAEALAACMRSIEGTIVLSYVPLGASIANATVCVGDVDGESTNVREQGTQLGSRDWPYQWTVTGYFWLDAPEIAYPAARAFVGQAVNAIDADRELGGEVEQASLSAYRIEPNDPDSVRRMLLAELTVSVVHLMTNPT